MKYILLIILSLTILNSCKTPIQEEKTIAKEKQIIHDNRDTIEANTIAQQLECKKYWKKRFPDDTTKARYINEVISKNNLSENNLIFLNALKATEQNDLAFNKVLSPIFRLSNSEIGILTFPKYKQIGNTVISVSKEVDLVEKFDTVSKNNSEYLGKVRFYPILLNSVFKEKSKPIINYYTDNKIATTQIKDLGVYVNQCLEYFEYSFDTTNISISDKLLFSSPFKIDLVFENNPKLDLLLQNDYKKECMDCPNSTKFQKSFARVKGTDNLYFVYADTFPINNELETPSRALILINHNEIIYLWYDEIDLFGCSCL